MRLIFLKESLPVQLYVSKRFQKNAKVEIDAIAEMGKQFKQPNNV